MLKAETRSAKSPRYQDAIVNFKKLCFQNVFRPHENEKPVFSNSSSLENVFDERLLWTVDLTVDFKFLRHGVDAPTGPRSKTFAISFSVI